MAGFNYPADNATTKTLIVKSYIGKRGDIKVK